MKSFCSILIATVALAGQPLHSQVVDGIQAVVHDSVVTFYEVDALTAPIAESVRRQVRTQDEFQRRIALARTENLDQLIERQLILHEFDSAGYSVPDSVIDEFVKEEIRAKFPDQATLIKSLQREGLTREKYRRQVRDQFIIRAMRSKNVAEEIMISPQKIKNYYLEHQDNFKLEDQVKLRMIVLNRLGETNSELRVLADDIRQKLEAGEPFTEMAAMYSSGSQQRQGGDWGWIERPVLRKELAEVAFNLKAGELSQVIETPEAYYVMLVEDVKSAHVKPLIDVQDEIEKTLLAQERARLEDQWIERLRKTTFIRYF
jgi:peptidyl-prolyl cis-trans isomerase SurA